MGGTQAAIFQSTVISEPIFNKFEELLEKDMQGILDHTKFANLNGKKSTYVNDDRKLVIHEIIPEKYCSTNFGLFVTKSTKEVKKLNLYRQQAAALAQRADVDPLAVLEVAAGENTAKIKQSLQRIQAESARRQAQMAEQENQMKAQATQEAIQLEQTFKQIEMVMKEDLLNVEWDRRDQNSLIEGEIELAKAGMSDGNANGIPDITEIMGHANEREKIYNEKARDRAEETIKKQELLLKNKELQHKIKESSQTAQLERENMKNDLQIAKENAKGRAKPSK